MSAMGLHHQQELGACGALTAAAAAVTAAAATAAAAAAAEAAAAALACNTSSKGKSQGQCLCTITESCQQTNPSDTSTWTPVVLLKAQHCCRSLEQLQKQLLGVPVTAVTWLSMLEASTQQACPSRAGMLVAGIALILAAMRTAQAGSTDTGEPEMPATACYSCCASMTLRCCTWCCESSGEMPWSEPTDIYPSLLHVILRWACLRQHRYMPP